LHAAESEMRPRATGVATGIGGVTIGVATGITTRVATGITTRVATGITTRVAIGIIGVTVGVGVPALPVIPMPLNHGTRPYVRPVAALVTARAAAAGVAVSRISVIARVCRTFIRIGIRIKIGALRGCGSGN